MYVERHCANSHNTRVVNLVKQFLKFIAVGSFFATVEEYLTIVVLRHDVGAYVFTLLILFPVFLTVVWSSSRLINGFVRSEPRQDLVHYFVYGGVGLMMEWFLMGLAPWSNPDANPAIMFIFQLGMFSFWATVAFAPRVFAKTHDVARRCRDSILRFYIPYFLAAYFIAFNVSAQQKFAAIISLILFGYLFVNVYFVIYFVRSFAQTRVATESPSAAA